MAVYGTTGPQRTLFLNGGCRSAKRSSTYANALFAPTRQFNLVQADHSTKIGGISPEQFAWWQREMKAMYSI